jgi:iron complex transport system permease protein
MNSPPPLLPRRTAARLGVVLVGALLVGLVVALALGSDGFNLPAATDWDLINAIRLPRALGALLTGALLGLAGALAQGLFRNPLADPYLLGSASGATLAVVITITLLSSVTVESTTLQFLVHLGYSGAAFVGALVGVALSLTLARGARQTNGLLLAGVVVGILLGALSNLLTLISPEALRGVQTFLYGSTSWLNFGSVTREAIGLVAILVLSVRYSRVLDALVLGDHTAMSLGIDLKRARAGLIVCMALATGLAVAETGLLAFVGLMSPHVVRRLVDTTHSGILVLSSLTGATLLLWADSIARWVWAPQELPVGLFTAIIGGGYLLTMLTLQDRWENH